MGLIGRIIKAIIRDRGNTKLNTRDYNGYRQYQKKDGSWEFTHRRVLEKKLSGKISKGNVVHHIDGNKKNNKSSNLQVMAKGEHSSLHLKIRSSGN